MNKDYAKKRRMIDAAKARKQAVGLNRRFSLWGWMSLGVVLGVLLSGAIYWKLNLAKTDARHSEVPIAQAKAAVKAPNATKNKASKTTKEMSARFDFYKVLPNLTPEIPEELQPHSHTPPTTKNTTSARIAPKQVLSNAQIKPIPSEKYFIQAGSFKQLKQAEELKAKLVLSGFEVRIQTVKIADSQTWYRVTMGPFEGKDKAHASQRKIDEAHALHSLVLKMQV